jgi:ketosteroid isomerase-like protein
MQPTTLLLLLSIFSGSSSSAQSGKPDSSDEALIRSLEKRVTAAVIQRDTAALRSLWSEHFMVNSPRNVVAPGRSVVFDLMARGIIHYASFESTIEHLRVDRGVAVVMGAETVRPIGKAPRAGQSVRRRFTHIWHKQGGQWLVVARHAHIADPAGAGS